MAKITVSDYIETLKALVATGQSEQEVQDNFAGFLEILRERHQLGLLDQILVGLNEKLNADKGRLVVRIWSDQELDESRRREIEKFLLDQSGMKQVTWLEREPLGSAGLILEAAGKRYDWSLERQLENFRQSMTLA